LLKLPSPAKLNLFLHITGKRADGYHNLQTVFQFLDYCDELTFTLRNDTQIVINDFSSEVTEQNNLILKAAKILQKLSSTAVGVDIHVKKILPLGGGVGGGSSNAATTLLALNKIWALNLSHAELLSIGLQLGSDVPIFLHGHACWAEGRGEILTPIILPEFWYVLLIPNCRINTATLFGDPRLTRDSEILKITHYSPAVGHNDFEPLVRMDYPEIAHALDWLGQFGKARMTGTGSTVFAAFDIREEASRIAEQSPESFKAVVAKGLNQSPLQTALANG
jgi:4-diphosphocytidyl-2-C-methyl-D-erythritol kinase